MRQPLLASPAPRSQDGQQRGDDEADLSGPIACKRRKFAFKNSSLAFLNFQAKLIGVANLCVGTTTGPSPLIVQVFSG